MKIVIPGGSGQVGTMLARSFHQHGNDVVILSRKAQQMPWRTVVWDAKTLGPWVAEIEGADVVINLAGRSVDCRYTPENRRQIMDSRVHSTYAIGQAIAQSTRPPRVWLQAATATIYAHRFDAPNDEATGIIGGNEPNAPSSWNFSISVAQAWEQSTNEANTPLTRKVLLRSAMTMSPDPGGIFSVLLRLVRFGLGGKIGDGKQFISWIHDQDFIHAINWLIEHEELDGPVNVASPNPLPYAGFMRELRKASGMPIGLPATEWMVEIGTRLLGTESELVLKSRRVVPGKLLDSGFQFQFPTWPEAADNLCQRWRNK